MTATFLARNMCLVIVPALLSFLGETIDGASLTRHEFEGRIGYVNGRLDAVEKRLDNVEASVSNKVGNSDNQKTGRPFNFDDLKNHLIPDEVDVLQMVVRDLMESLSVEKRLRMSLSNDVKAMKKWVERTMKGNQNRMKDTVVAAEKRMDSTLHLARGFVNKTVKQSKTMSSKIEKILQYIASHNISSNRDISGAGSKGLKDNDNQSAEESRECRLKMRSLICQGSVLQQRKYCPLFSDYGQLEKLKINRSFLGSKCQYGVNFGVNEDRTAIWVSAGCRASFQITYTRCD